MVKVWLTSQMWFFNPLNTVKKLVENAIYDVVRIPDVPDQ